ncbi:ORF1234 [White spot syndrome virus]|uniref:ORF1234 n=1 Tax=White spot syndrome virus TaxID=342409 RepID=A0A2D3I783_9VIRU|nr:ORF1234 [White spot syndrome virus]
MYLNVFYFSTVVNNACYFLFFFFSSQVFYGFTGRVRDTSVSVDFQHRSGVKQGRAVAFT